MRCLTCLSGAKDCDPLFGSLFTFLTLLRLAQPSWLVLPFAGFARPSGSHCFYSALQGVAAADEAGAAASTQEDVDMAAAPGPGQTASSCH